MSKKSILLIASIAAIIISCKKTTDTTPPAITITSPTEGQMFMTIIPDSILVSATITDPDMHSYTILATNATTGDTLFSQPEMHLEETSISINKKFKALYKTPVIASTTYVLEISAEDHNNNASSKTINFNIMP